MGVRALLVTRPGLFSRPWGSNRIESRPLVSIRQSLHIRSTASYSSDTVPCSHPLLFSRTRTGNLVDELLGLNHKG